MKKITERHIPQDPEGVRAKLRLAVCPQGGSDAVMAAGLVKSSVLSNKVLLKDVRADLAAARIRVPQTRNGLRIKHILDVILG